MMLPRTIVQCDITDYVCVRRSEQQNAELVLILNELNNWRNQSVEENPAVAMIKKSDFSDPRCDVNTYSVHSALWHHKLGLVRRAAIC